MAKQSRIVPEVAPMHPDKGSVLAGLFEHRADVHKNVLQPGSATAAGHDAGDHKGFMHADPNELFMKPAVADVLDAKLQQIRHGGNVPVGKGSNKGSNTSAGNEPEDYAT